MNKRIDPATLSPTVAALRAARGAGRRRVRRLAPAGPGCVVGYLRVSGEEQAATGLGIDAQLSAIKAECASRGLTLCAVYRDEGVSGRTAPDKRKGLVDALTALDNGEASILMVAKVDRLARSMADLALIVQLGERAGWNVVALNSPFDTTTPTGAAMASMMGFFAQLEAAMGSERMKAAMAVRRARGEQLGRPSKVSDEARTRLRELREQGLSWPKVAEAMNVEGWPTSTGPGHWHPATARRLAPAD